MRLNRAPAEIAPSRYLHRGERRWRHIRLRNRFANTVTNCVENFIDIPHTAFVQTGIFRTTQGQRIVACVERNQGAVHVVYRNERANLGNWRRLLNPRGDEIRHTDSFYVPNITCVTYEIGKRTFIITSQSVPAGADDDGDTLVYTEAQRQMLARLVRAAAATAYGRLFGLCGDDDIDRFRAKLPPVGYAALEPWIERARNGEPDVLAPGRVRHFEPTSGTGGGAKLIPYNDALLGSFRSLFAIWAHDLLQHALRPRWGRVFIGVSPRLSAQAKARHDADYLRGPLRLLLAPFFVAPDRRQTDTDPAGFRDAVALAVLGCPELEVISVWSPTYLLVLLAHVEARRENSRRASRTRAAPTSAHFILYLIKAGLLPVRFILYLIKAGLLPVRFILYLIKAGLLPVRFMAPSHGRVAPPSFVPRSPRLFTCDPLPARQRALAGWDLPLDSPTGILR